MRTTQHNNRGLRQIIGGDEPGSQGIADVVVDVSDGIRNLADLPFKGIGGFPVLPQYAFPGLGMLKHTFPHLTGQVEALSCLFQYLYHPNALYVVTEASGIYLVQNIFPNVPEWGMTQVMSQ